MGCGRVKFPIKGSIRLPYDKISMFSIFNLYFWRRSLLSPWNDDANLIVRYPCSNQSGVRQVTHPSKGPMRGQYVFLMAKYCVFMNVFYLSYYSWKLCLLFPWNDYVY